MDLHIVVQSFQIELHLSLKFVLKYLGLHRFYRFLRRDLGHHLHHSLLSRCCHDACFPRIDLHSAIIVKEKRRAE